MSENDAVSDSLAVDKLCVSYRTGGVLGRFRGGHARTEVLAGVDLQVRPAETLALVGESGCGKTTLARAVLGLVPVTGGSVRVNGIAGGGRGDRSWRAIRRQVGILFQDPIASLDPRMTACASVTEAFHIHGVRGLDLREEARRLLGQVGLPARFLDRYPHQLSGGQARRVSLARAMALQPKLVIADEPTAGLDLSVQGEVLNLMLELQRALGVSYLLITHNLSIARHVADRVAVMHLGRVVETGATDAVFEAPEHAYTRALLGAHSMAGAVA